MHNKLAAPTDSINVTSPSHIKNQTLINQKILLTNTTIDQNVWNQNQLIKNLLTPKIHISTKVTPSKKIVPLNIPTTN